MPIPLNVSGDRFWSSSSSSASSPASGNARRSMPDHVGGALLALKPTGHQVLISFKPALAMNDAIARLNMRC